MTRSGLRRVILASSVLLLAASLWGCGGSNQEKSLGSQDDGREVTLQVGQTLAISLEANPTTGYTWQVLEMDTNILQPLGDTQFKQAPGSEGLTGAGGVETLRFEALAAGQTPLTLGYMRPWESVPPLKTFSVQVIVR